MLWRHHAGLGKFEAKFSSKGYDDLQFVLSASSEEMKRLGKDLEMKAGDLELLRKGIDKSVALVKGTGSSSIEGYCQALRKQGGRATSQALIVSEKKEVEPKTAAGGPGSPAVDLKGLFDTLFRTITDTSISKEDRKAFDDTGSGATYGYMTWTGVSQMLRDFDVAGKVFFDLGSGVGKPVIAAAMQFPELKQAIGIELSANRHQRAANVYAKIQDQKVKSKITFKCESMLTSDLSQADIIYISSLCFPKQFLKRLGAYLDTQLKPGCIVMSSKECPMTRGMKGPRPVVEMSWNLKHQLYCYTMQRQPLPSPNTAATTAGGGAEGKDVVEGLVEGRC